MTAGDALCQCIRARTAGREARLDWRQSARFGLVGLTLHGPFFFHGFRWLDARFGAAATLQKALVKTAAGQITLFPLYTASFFMYMGILEGLPPAQAAIKVQRVLPPTLMTGSMFWPAANVLNFMFVPPTYRVLYANVAGLFWNAWLSYENSTKGQVAAAAGAAGGAAAAAAAGGAQ
ncbi:peroxisomal membrane [Micractinium conductrix]|uniref:Peroxisomal membrane n=1 Tax=Micractinium conductrix TaxID=554055 RepID=A0A2P6VFU0_9CHLO|nr:peroxisomal membrane [Micractinium conductrix]|eukprot:PSC72962.1 peroxisomal membrane [Micractinium conductrix]